MQKAGVPSWVLRKDIDFMTLGIPTRSAPLELAHPQS